MGFLLILSVIVSFIVWAILKNNNGERRKFAIYILKLWLFILIAGIISYIIGLNYYNYSAIINSFIVFIAIPIVIWFILNKVKYNRYKKFIFILKLWLLTYIIGVILNTIEVIGYTPTDLVSLFEDKYSGLLLVMNYGYIISLTILSSTMFLNVYEKFASNILFRFLSFFLLSSIFLFIELFHRTEKEEIDIILYPIAIPFWVSSAIVFIIFSIKYEKKFKNLKNS